MTTVNALFFQCTLTTMETSCQGILIKPINFLYWRPCQCPLLPQRDFRVWLTTSVACSGMVCK